jgi:RNA polymerase sigma-70 factor (ECF subfamily)
LDEHQVMAASRPAAALAPPDELVRRAAAGDVSAFARIVRLHHEDLVRVATVVVGDPAAAAEAAGEAWPVAWSGLRRPRAPVALGSWLCSLAATEAVTRAGASTGPAGPDGEALVAAPGATVAADHGARAADPELTRILAAMAPADRALVALRHIAGLSMTELAQALPGSTAGLPQRTRRLDAAIAGPGPGDADSAAHPGPGPGADPNPDSHAVARRAGERLRAYAAGPPVLVDADATARRARAEVESERDRRVSVAIALVVGVIVAAHPYLAQLAFRG